MSLLLLLEPQGTIEQPVQIPYTEVSIWDEFDNPHGAFPNYTAYDAQQQTQLQAQRHVDLRAFVQDDTLVQIPMLYLDLLTMSGLDQLTIGQLEQQTLVKSGERWTANVTVRADQSRKNWNVLSLTCRPGVNITSSVFTS